MTELYELTVTATITDVEKLTVKLAMDVVVASPSLRGAAMSVIPHHLRKIATDLEEGSTHD